MEKVGIKYQWRKLELEKITFYASEDADVAFQLTHIFEKKLKKQNLDNFFNEIEMPLLPVLLEMEFNGMFVDGKDVKFNV